MNKSFVFWGSDEFSVKVLEVIISSSFMPTAIITVPPKPVGRKKIITPTPIALFAKEKNIRLIEEENIKSDSFANEYKGINPDIAIVASYGKIIPTEILNTPKYKTFNVHPSLLPKWRGATPIEHTIMHDDIAGVTIIELDEKMDHGPIVFQKEISMKDPDSNPLYYSELRDILAQNGGQMIVELLQTVPEIEKTPQNHSEATFTKLLSKGDGKIDLMDNPYLNIRKIRALSNWPETYFLHKNGDKEIRVIIKEAQIENNTLVLKRVIPEGKKEMDFESFKRGYLERKSS